MPGYRTHQITGLVAIGFIFIINKYVSLFNPDLSIINILVILGIALFYSVLPDIDIGTSKVRKYVQGAGLFLIIFCFLTDLKILGIVVSVLLLLMTFMLNHRGKIHSVVASFLFSVPLFFLNPLFMIMGIVAYLSHLFLDKEVKLI